MSPTEIQTISSVVSAIVNTVLTLSIIAAFLQVRAAQKTIKAEVLMKLSGEWRTQEIYEAVIYIHTLRQAWKSAGHPVSDWQDLAEKWVKEHTGKNPESADPSERKLWKEWVWRRNASQFLSKMGLMILEGYIGPDDLFGVIPEMGRLLAVLTPIEIAIQKYWAQHEQTPIAEWDHPFPKWEFDALWKQYQQWYKKNAGKRNLKPVSEYIILEN